MTLIYHGGQNKNKDGRLLFYAAFPRTQYVTLNKEFTDM